MASVNEHSGPTDCYVAFDVNDYVRVKLTDRGRKIHRQQFRQLNRQLPETADLKYSPPNEDEDGWCKFQLWDLMQRFGPYIGMCEDLVFETTIEFVTAT